MVVKTLIKANVDKKKVLKHSILWLNISLISSLFWANSFLSPKQNVKLGLTDKSIQKAKQADLLFTKSLSKRIFSKFYFDVQSDNVSIDGLAFKKVLNREAYIAYNLASFSVSQAPRQVDCREFTKSEEVSISNSFAKRTHRYKLASRGFSPGLYFAQNKLSLVPVPSYTRISSVYGNRHGQFHKGIDMEAPVGSKIVSVLPGFVEFAGWKGAYGKTVIINHGNNMKSLYAHASSLNVKTNEWINSGQEIAQVGTSGDATGPHLHFETILNGVNVNPQKFMKD